MTKRRSRVKIIPNKAFHKMWDIANGELTLSEYINIFTSIENKKPVIDFKKYNMDYVETIDMLRCVYELAHYSFREILEKGGKKKAQVSDIFCIPIRTIEEWYSGNNSCNSYIRLMLLREFHLLEFGSKYIKLQSDVVYLQTLPGIYEHHTSSLKCSSVDEDPEIEVENDTCCFSELSSKSSAFRTEGEYAFFKKYGFFPDKGVSWD